MPDELREVNLEDAEDRVNLIHDLRTILENPGFNEETQQILDRFWGLSGNPEVAEYLFKGQLVGILLNMIVQNAHQSRCCQLCLGLLANLCVIPHIAVSIGGRSDLKPLLDTILALDEPSVVFEYLRLLYTGLCHDSSRYIFLSLIHYRSLLMWLDLSNVEELANKVTQILLLLQIYDSNFVTEVNETFLNVLGRVLAEHVGNSLNNVSESFFDSFLQLIEAVSSLHHLPPLDYSILSNLAQVIENYNGSGSESAIIALANFLSDSPAKSRMLSEHPFLLEQISQLISRSGYSGEELAPLAQAFAALQT